MKFRKKPVVIEAIRFWPETCAAVCAFIGIEHHDSGRCGIDTPLIVHTLEGEMRATVGDWIIRGVADEFYPCKPEIFETTYESA